MPEHCSPSRAKQGAIEPRREVLTSLATHPLGARGPIQAMRAHATQLNARVANRTGLPDGLKAGMEGLSRVSLDDVAVHRNSPKPAQLQAHAYTQGSDIHLGPGQERHLAHELAHVVQQKQGRVRATVQAHGLPINDDAGLEREADAMGARAAAWTGAGGSDNQPTRGAAIAGRSMPIQRKARFLLDQAPVPLDMKGVAAVLARLREAKRALDDKLPSLAMVANLPGRLIEMMHGETEHGTFDLDSPQGVLLLSFELLKTNQGAKAPTGGSGGNQASASASKQPGSGGSGGAMYETVFLGAGASIAYYLAAGHGQYSPNASLIIALPDPWAGKRGPGVVAHPESMITPMLEFLGRKIDSIWTERGKFAELVGSVIKGSGLPLIPEAVVSVGETPEGNYLIKTDAGRAIVARNVVSGMGSGEHRLPDVDPQLVAATGKQVTDDPEKGGAIAKRVMNMDVFTQVADRIYGEGGKILLAPAGKAVPDRKARAGIHMVLSGGNGGIDVAFSGLQKGFKVTWLVGPGAPNFLEGFFNYAARYAYDRSLQVKPGAGAKTAPPEPQQRMLAIKQHLKALYHGQEHVLLRDVVDYFAGGARFEAVHFGNAGAVAVKGSQVGVQVVAGDGKAMGQVNGDLFVYAHGQDGSALEIFGGLLPKMTPLIDANLRFLNPDSRENPAVKSGQKPQQETVLGMTHQSKGGGSIKLIGAAGYRHRGQKPRAMAPVIDSLPPNVLLNDQLTPSRSQIEAQLNYVRPNAGSFADFVTDDRTQLAVHIAARYPYIPASDAEKHVAMIILSRRAGLPGKKEIKAVPPNSEAFQLFWETTLARLNFNAEIEAKLTAERDAEARTRAVALAKPRSKL